MKAEPLVLTCKLVPNNNFIRESELFTDHEGVLIYQPSHTNISWKDCLYKHLHLISKREIKAGEWYFGSLEWKEPLKRTGGTKDSDYKTAYKIEFTNDPQLIKDGVAAIDGNTKAWVHPFSFDNNITYTKFEVNFLNEYCKRYNKEYDIQKLVEEAENEYQQSMINHISNKDGAFRSEIAFQCTGFRHGYLKALQSNGGFSLGDMKAMAIEVADWKDGYVGKSDGRNLHHIIDAFIQSLTKNQPKGDIIIECEIDEYPSPITSSGTDIGRG